MRASGPSRNHSTWAPNAWMSRNMEEALRTTRSPVTTGNTSSRPLTLTAPAATHKTGQGQREPIDGDNTHTERQINTWIDEDKTHTDRKINS